VGVELVEGDYKSPLAKKVEVGTRKIKLDKQLILCNKLSNPIIWRWMAKAIGALEREPLLFIAVLTHNQ
jgi:hypothetical protein